SITLKLVGSLGKSARASFATLAYRGAYSASSLSADASSLPERHHPGQSAALAKTRLPPTSRYTRVPELTWSRLARRYWFVAVAPTIPPKTIAAATTDAKTRTRVLSMPRSSVLNLRAGLDSGESFEAGLSLAAP